MDDSKVDNFYRQLPEQRTVGAAGRLLAEAAVGLGWDLAAFAADRQQALLPRNERGEYVAVSMGWSGHYINDWVRQQFGRHCPVTQQCGRTSDSFCWDADPDSTQWEQSRLHPEQRQVLDYYHEYVDGAVTVPVHRPGGKTGYVSWFSRKQCNLRRQFKETYRDTYLMSHAFIRQLDRIAEGAASDSAQDRKLTPRELECLGWAARGKTEEEIGLILERSRETVHFHLCNAARKLQASNRTHAVALACSQGLITVL